MTLKKMAAAAAALSLLVTMSPAQAAPVEKSDRVLVKFKAGQDLKAVAAKHGASLKKELRRSGWAVVHVPSGKAAEFVEKLNRDVDAVERAEVDEQLHMLQTIPNDPTYPSQWHLPKIQAHYAWDITKGSDQRTIAIIDTGVDVDHPDLSAKIVPGYDFVNNDANADDDQGHGTFAAGLAAASTNNALNGAGVDWNAKIMPVKVLSATGSGYTSDIIDGIYYAADNGAHVINMSLGGGSYSQAFQDAINYAHVSRNAIVVAAAGSDATSTKTYPAAYNNVVAVAATDSADKRASYSSYGSWIDVAAPGSSVTSTKMGGGTTTMSGTSWSSAIVSGAMSVVWSKHLDYDNDVIINRLLQQSDAITGTGTQWYWGRINLYRAVLNF